MTRAGNPRSGPSTPGLIRWSARCAWALALALTWGAPRAWAQEEAADTPALPGGDAPQAPPWKTRFGAMLDVGAPEGVGAAVLVRPMRWLRVHAGATTNTLGFGARAGASFLPIQLFISPTLDLDVGYYFNADYGKLLSRIGGQPNGASTLIHHVDCGYASANLGLEFSPARFLSLFARFGIGYWSIQVNDVESFIREAADDPNITAGPLLLGLTSPTLKLGLIVYFN